MNILLIAATGAEIAPLTEYISSSGNRSVDILITGVGMVATAYSLTKALSQKKYDLVIQAGISGSFNHSIHPGQVVFIISEEYGDLGAEDHDEYLDIFELGLIRKDTFPFTDGKLINPITEIHNGITLPRVSGLTINTVSGNENTIRQLKLRYGCDVESMEGAAFHYICLMENVDFMQIRSVSNYIEPRDRSKWRMQEAIQNLNIWVIQFLKNYDL
jgi:futalosine hydrolase